MLEELPKFKRGQFKKEYSKLSETDKSILDDYENYCLIGANEDKAKDMKRNVLKFVMIMDKPINDIDLKSLRHYLKVLNKSKVSDYTKNDMKVHVKKFLRWRFKDWSKRFDELNDIKQITSPKRKRKITENTILTKEEIEKMMKTETRMFYKAFFITQYEGALRTKEVRHLKWGDLKDEGDFISINLHATKTKEDRPIILREAKFYLDKLKEIQENKNDKGKYIFHGVTDVNKPIDKSTISVWMRDLSQKALGRRVWAYLLRHTRGTELRKMVKNGNLSKDNAIEFMGHSEKMFDKIYSHLDQTDIKEMLKEQIYNFEDLPEEKKDRIKELEKTIRLVVQSIRLLSSGDIKNMEKKVKELETLTKT